MSAIPAPTWHERAHQNVGAAHMAHQAAMNQADNSVQSHDNTVIATHDMYKDVVGVMDNKVSNTRSLVETLNSRAWCLDGSLQQTRESLLQLQTAMRAKDGPMQLCLWRLGERTKRCDRREQVRDNAEISLEEERATLYQTQMDLADAIERTKDMIRQLLGRMSDVREDLRHKTHSLGVDEVSLANAQSSYATMAARTPQKKGPLAGLGKSPGIRRMPERFGQLEGDSNEQMRMQRTMQLEKHSADHDEAARILCEQNTRLMDRCHYAVLDAKAHSDRCLGDRITECQHMKTRLENEIRQTDSKIDHTSGIMGETNFHMNNLQEPMSMHQKTASVRADRTNRENILDPVTAHLAANSDGVMQAHANLSMEHQKEKQHLQSLHDHRRQLEEDLHGKALACSIDQRCLKMRVSDVVGTQHMGGVGPPLPPGASPDYYRIHGPPLPNHGDPLPGRGGHTMRSGQGDPLAYGRGGASARANSSFTHRDYSMAGSMSPVYGSGGRTTIPFQAEASKVNSFRLSGSTSRSGTPRGLSATGTSVLKDTARASWSYQ